MKEILPPCPAGPREGSRAPPSAQRMPLRASTEGQGVSPSVLTCPCAVRRECAQCGGGAGPAAPRTASPVRDDWPGPRQEHSLELSAVASATTQEFLKAA